jgi:choice-of-anchor A domain-containing protein
MMRRPTGSIFLGVLFTTALIPATSMADWEHSWCVSGRPIYGDVPVGTDPNTVNVVNWVCGQGGHSECCNPQGWWSMACVQRGAAYAKEHNLIIEGSSDYCGRYAWAQGPIANTKQYYPRDFNLFVLGGDASSFTDVNGPVAAAGKITTSGFNLSNSRSQPVALVAKGDIDIASGTVFGQIYYGGTYNDHGTVRVVNPTWPSTPPPPPTKDPQIVDFTTASTKLHDMSEALFRYTAKKAMPMYGTTLAFNGDNPELNVFSVSSSELTSVYSYVFNVPQGSAIIINVRGSSATIKNAGFSGPNGGGWSSIPTPLYKIFWNFEATSLTIQSVEFPGSILAPDANATFKWGSISGTAVVKKAVSTSELYMSRYQTPGPGGCLWADANWSCSNDTTLDDSGKAANLAAEAGFLEIEGGPYVAEGHSRMSPTHRIWYSFHPAGPTPERMPLAVIFNGGPGASTTAALFSSTAPMKLTPNAGYNSNTWTQFANLLYIDAPVTGFSYPLPYNGAQQDIGTDMDRDAGIFLRVIFQFLARHPMLLDNRVILVGESYGGTRATLMLSHLYNYNSLPTSEYRDWQLITNLENYFLSVFNTKTPTSERIRTRFGHQVLISPAVVGQDQQDQMDEHMIIPPGLCLPPCTNAGCPEVCYLSGQVPGSDPVEIIYPTCDRYNCDKRYLWSFDEMYLARDNLLGKISTLNYALGVDSRTIKWMRSSERQQAYGRKIGISSQAMKDNFNWGLPLSTEDSYFVTMSYVVETRYGNVYKDNKPPYTEQNPHPARMWADYPNDIYPWETNTSIPIGKAFLNNLFNQVETFITVTKYDAQIWTPAIEYALNNGSYTEYLGSADYMSDYVTDIKNRPGAMSIDYNASYSSASRVVTMPFYESGHTVPMRTPAELLADVMEWYFYSKN